MNYSLNLVDWFALAPGIHSQEDWQNWFNKDLNVHEQLAKYKKIPMMAARRMSVPSRLAVETGLSLLESHQPDAAIFISRHGELERTYNIVHNLATQTDISPTDFAMSVHNTAAGLFTITAKTALPITSLAASCDGFQQGMLEVQAMLAGGAKQILLIDFDGLVPQAYHEKADFPANNLCYAAGFILCAGEQLHCQQQSCLAKKEHHQLPQSLIFLNNWLNEEQSFVIQGERSDWQWYR